MSSYACYGIIRLNGIDADNLYVMLVHTGRYPNEDFRGVRNVKDIANMEIPSKPVVIYGYSGKSYRRYEHGGQKLDARIEGGVVMANPTSWSGDIRASGAFIYQLDGAQPYDSPVIAYFDFGSEQASVNGTFTIKWSSDGLIRLDGGGTFGSECNQARELALDDGLSEALEVFAELSR